jgi:hypothetical protein
MTDIHYCKSKKIDLGKIAQDFRKVSNQRSDSTQSVGEDKSECLLQKIEYNPFHIQNLQNYNPVYSMFFEMNPTNYNAIALNHPKHFIDLNTVLEEGTGKKISKDIHIKYAPLLDPIHYLIGKYEKERSRLTILPTLPGSESETKGLRKIESLYNSAYIDCFFSYLSSNLLQRYDFKNGIDFYGSYLGVQEKFKMDISDDYDYLLESDFFHSKKNVFYEIESSIVLPMEESGKGSSFSMKPKLHLGEIVNEDIGIDADILDEEILDLGTDTLLFKDIVLDTITEKEEISALELIYEKGKETEKEDDDSSEDSEDNSIENHSIHLEEDGKDEEDNWSDIDDSLEDSEASSFEEPMIYAYIRDFPVQLICLEKGEGTLDALLEKEELEDAQIASALFQVVMSLAAFQKAYDFTHNDLHTNNIVYFPTEHTHLEYTFLAKTYKVPTYGRIYKIIDFGRSIYRFQDKVLGSDSFSSGGDANGQYNCEPFFNPKKPEIKTNPSFDLCRLGCSMYDFVFDGLEEDEIRSSKKKWTEVQKTIARWCMDDNGKNILYTSSGEERYPNFKLYKMIARMVHAHTPENQMTFPLFSQYDVSKKVDKKKKIKPLDHICKINIDVIPKLFV